MLNRSDPHHPFLVQNGPKQHAGFLGNRLTVARHVYNTGLRNGNAKLWHLDGSNLFGDKR